MDDPLHPLSPRCPIRVSLWARALSQSKGPAELWRGRASKLLFPSRSHPYARARYCCAGAYAVAVAVACTASEPESTDDRYDGAWVAACPCPLTATHLSSPVLDMPPPLATGIAPHSSPSDNVTLSSTSVPGAVASVCSESSNSSSSSLSSPPLSSLVESSAGAKGTGGGAIVGDIGAGKPSTGGGGGGGGGVEGGGDRDEGGCELMYMSGLGSVTSGRNGRRDRF